jgi:hypothetical protein
MQIQLASQSCCQHLSSLRSGSPLQSIGSLGDLPGLGSHIGYGVDRRFPRRRRRLLPRLIGGRDKRLCLIAS